ncbi:LutC/YkgG family protein [Megamonas funiformis]|jgi:L-lactate dehydrogenase complex protein LldG|uniref:LutC/YkgG family protein n=1 Tax=Megamonas funiformis TaxID=437897 RepID=UPI000E54748D|nr:lactate utilization protein [Megamonas funiformis]RGW42952.1 FeS-binding protein [Megamonas funiformis]
MEKICHDWKHLLDKDFTNGKYWNDFVENAQNASVEIKIVKSYKDAIADILKIAKATDAKMIAGVGADECEELADVYVEVNKSFKVYTDKFDIVKNKNELDIGITLGEFGVGETGSICVDNYAYEVRIASMLPLINIIFMPKNCIVNNMQDAFDVLAKVFWKGYSGFVTGPSRTSDIERVLTLGVHGPSRVILFAIEDDKR